MYVHDMVGVVGVGQILLDNLRRDLTISIPRQSMIKNEDISTTEMNSISISPFAPTF